MFRRQVCLEHSKKFQSKCSKLPDHCIEQSRLSRGRAVDQCSLRGGEVRLPQNPTTSFLIATTLIYAIGAGITAATGTRLALQLFLVKGLRLFSFQLPDYDSPALLFVSTFLSRDWVICAPAAFLGCGSRFLGSLFGTEP